jgi:hypothetical protein
MRAHPTPLGLLETSAVREYAETVRAAFLRSMEAAPDWREGCFCVAGHMVVILASEPALFARLTRALEHLRVPAGTPADLTIHVWDAAAPGSKAPISPPAWYARQQNEIESSFLERTRFDARGELPALNTAGIRTSFHMRPSMLRLLDTARNEAFYWVKDAATLPSYEAGSPFHQIFAWWMAERSVSLIHSAAVGTGAGGVLISGPPGAGKSTSALACARAGLGYVGDDYCLMRPDPEPYVYSLYNTGKLKSPRNLERFPEFAAFAPHAELLDNLKAVMFLQFVPGICVMAGFPVRAVVVPRIGNSAGAKLSPLSAAKALEALVSTIRQVPDNGRALRPMARLVQKVPCYLLDTGPNLSAIPPVIRQLLVG